MVLNQPLFKTILAQVLDYFLNVINEAERDELVQRLSTSVLQAELEFFLGTNRIV